MTATMKKLSAEDQKTFLAEVNEAISKMPGSNESLTATYLNVNHAALKGSQPGNLATLVAEVFATVPPESLAVINERFAADLFNRAADPSVTYTDEQYEQIAKSLVEKVVERNAQVENGAARSTFAILMMVRASNGSPANLSDSLVDVLPTDSRNIARNEWIPSAMGANVEKSYEPLLGAAEAVGSLPSSEMVIRIAGPQLLEALLGEVVEGTPVVSTSFNIERDANLPVKEVVPETPTEPQGYPNQE
jgi:adenylate kinase